MQALLHETHEPHYYSTVMDAYDEAAALQLAENVGEQEPSHRWEYVVVPVAGKLHLYTIIILDECGLFVTHWG